MLCIFLQNDDFVHYNEETEISSDEVNLLDENDEPLDTGGELHLH